MTSAVSFYVIKDSNVIILIYVYKVKFVLILLLLVYNHVKTGGEFFMNIFSYYNNPFGLILIILPLLTFIISLVSQILIKKKIVILSIVFIGYLIATFTIFNSSFLIWCFIYTFISLIATLLADLIIKYTKKSRKQS